MFKKDNRVEAYSKLYVYLGIGFVVCLLLADILATKIFAIGKYSVPSSIMIFPVSFIINDILAEVYGYKNAKRIIVMGFFMRLLMVTLFTLAIIIPAPDWYTNSDAFKTILGSTPRIVLAGFLSYFCGSLANAKVLVKMKSRSEKGFGIRAIVSTIAGEGIDSLIFIPVAYLGTVEFSQIIKMIILQVTLKTLYEAVCLPLTTVVIKHTKKYESIFNSKVKVEA